MPLLEALANHVVRRGGSGGGMGGWGDGGWVAIPFEGALEYVQTPESSEGDCTSFLRKILLVLSHAECA